MKNKDKVVFRRFKNGAIIALFPDMFVRNGLITSYQHIGQHGDADYQHVIKITDPVSDKEAEPLKKELTEIGYNI